MKYLSLIAFTLLVNLLYSQENPKSEALNSMIEQGIKDWNIPGLAAVVVKDGEIVFKKTYGIKNTNTGEKVDTNTLFNMASTTKAMVAMSMGILVDRGKINWDDKVQKYLPEFKLADPYVASDARIVDLFTHNLGIGNADILWALDSTSTKIVLNRFQHAKKSYPLRGGFIYQNIMYAVAGEVIAKVSGQHWTDFIKKNLFLPLSMNRTLGKSADIFKAGNYASPHYEDDEGLPYRVDHTLTDQIGPAGMIWSSIDDISQYLRFLTNNGMVGTDTIISPRTFKYLFEPKTILSNNGRYPTNALTKPHFNTYALGWFQQDYRGEKLNFHTGSLIGLIAIAGVIHDQNMAVYVFANMDHAELRHAILYKAIDLFVFDDDSRQWHNEILKLYKNNESEKKALKKLEKSRIEGTSPTLELQAYAGIYKNDLIGKIEISLDDNFLHFEANEKMRANLVHWHYDTFILRDFGKFKFTLLANFNLDSFGKPITLDVAGETFLREN